MPNKCKNEDFGYFKLIQILELEYYSLLIPTDWYEIGINMNNIMNLILISVGWANFENSFMNWEFQ